jgi:dihydropteroate synthase
MIQNSTIGKAAERRIDLPSGSSLRVSGFPVVMAIVNCTDDSFYPASRTFQDGAVEAASRAEAEGAEVIDFGGESSRPGARYISEEEELRRLIPVIQSFRHRSSLPISVDTRKASVARAALDAGADIINDISALTDDPSMGVLCAERNAPIVLMHKKGNPENMQRDPFYGDVVREVKDFLRDAVLRAKRSGLKDDRIILDPGIGFGKRLEDNMDLIAHLEEIRSLGYPILIGLSRKYFVGQLTDQVVENRLAGTLGATVVALATGASIFRVHDPRSTLDALKVAFPLLEQLTVKPKERKGE